ncbi:MAG: glycerol-3-phosphate dehydrogenase/oxidase, partial [Vicinamibacterales bacterium]
MMLRDIRRLADTRFDVVVIGAGFYGAIAAWDATLRGLSVALVDKGDFGAGTSFNNLKTLHGGLRSLQVMNLPQMRLFIRERRALARVAPHLVKPMPFVIPTYGHYKRSALLMRAALMINDAISHDRHEGLPDPGLQLPPGELISRDECLQFNPVIAPEGVTGGAIWHDYQMHNTDRMTLSFALSAAERGAVAANYVRAVDVLRDGARVAGVRVEDQLTTERFEIRARAVVNAGGPWATSWLQEVAPRATSPAPLLSRAMNLVTRRVVTTHACGGLARGRFLFLIPWRGLSLLGTSHDAHAGTADQLEVTRHDLEAFLNDGREAFPQANLATADVHLVHRGLLPMISGNAAHVKLLRESTVVDHGRDGAPGLISMFGVRYTTARDTAARAIDAVFRDRGVATVPVCRTAETPVSGGAIDHKESFLRAALLAESSIPQEMLRRLALTYGTNHEAVVDLVRAVPDLGAPLGQQCTISQAEIVHAVRAESAVKLSDALIRRTEAGSAGHPGIDAIESAGVTMKRELGW